MKIKDPVLIEKQVRAIYEIDVEGVRIQATYAYTLEDEMNGGWDYDLSPCFEGLDDDEIEDLEEEFLVTLYDLEV
jgi:hypothetical protein